MRLVYIVIVFFAGLALGLALTPRADRRQPGSEQLLASNNSGATFKRPVLVGENPWPVLSITDGDTFNIMYQFDGPQPERVRLAGVECPEKSTARGKVARDYLKSILSDSEVFLELEDPDKPRESYGRLLVYAYVPTATGSQDIGQALIRHAGCYVYKRYDGRKLHEYLAAECSRLKKTSCDF